MRLTDYTLSGRHSVTILFAPEPWKRGNLQCIWRRASLEHLAIRRVWYKRRSNNRPQSATRAAFCGGQKVDDHTLFQNITGQLCLWLRRRALVIFAEVVEPRLNCLKEPIMADIAHEF